MLQTRTMTSDFVSDLDFIMSTILRQRTDSPPRKAFLRAGVTDIGDSITLCGRHIAQLLKFPDDSFGSVVLEKLADEDQQLIHCFVAFFNGKIADGNLICSDWQNLTDFQEFQIIGHASCCNAWCHWCNVSCNKTHDALHNARCDALDNDRDTDRFNLKDDDAITPVMIPSKPSRLGSCFLSLADGLFEQDIRIDSHLSASAADLNSRQSSSVVDCCVDLDNNDGMAVVVAVDPVPNDAGEAAADPLGGENESGQVKPRNESSRQLHDCVSSSVFGRRH
jgi:hypothetical protein